MSPSTDKELRAWLTRYVSGRVSLRDFQEWLAPRAWILDADEAPEQARLADRIELLLAEWSNGHWTEDELKERLGAYAVRVDVESPLLQRLSSSVLGRQPENATQYVGDRPLFARPRVLVA